MPSGSACSSWPASRASGPGTLSADRFDRLVDSVSETRACTGGRCRLPIFRVRAARSADASDQRIDRFAENRVTAGIRRLEEARHYAETM